MAFYGFAPSFVSQAPQIAQYHVFQSPIVMAVQPVMPLTIMLSPPPVFAMPTASSPVLPPGAPTGRSSSAGSLHMLVVFYGHSDGYARSDAHSSHDNLPSRDGLLALLATFAKHHGITIRHAGGRIDAAKVKVYVMSEGSRAREGELCGLKVEKGAEGLVTTGDVVKVLGLDVDEGVWEGEMRALVEGRREVVVGVDMGGDGDGAGGGGGAGGASATAA